MSKKVEQDIIETLWATGPRNCNVLVGHTLKLTTYSAG
jgi:hypothetical protein